MIPGKAVAPIPSPPKKPVLGNMLDVSAVRPVQDLVALARELGPIFQLDMMGKPITVVSGYALADELFDESRFDKSVRGALHRVRTISGDGLFTAYTTEPNWSRAHNILLPNFGDRAMQGYHPMMLDVAEQMMLKWDRLNADEEIDVVHDMTALTLDTIGLCGFGYRFNSFYREDNHPFVDAMVDALEIAMSQRGLPFEEMFTRPRQARLAADAKFLNGVVDRIVRERKEQRDGASTDAPKSDMLDYMLAGVDRKSGERLDDTNIRYQIITFLIAGHETTSGLLSFATYFLLTNPDVLARATEEVDRVLGTDVSVKPTMRQVNALSLRPAGAQGVAAPVADRAGLRAAPVQGRGDRRQVRAQGARAGRGAAAVAPSRSQRVGRTCRDLRPGELFLRAGAGTAEQCVQTVRQRPAGVHRAAVRDAGGDAGDRDDVAALPADRPPALRRSRSKRR